MRLLGGRIACPADGHFPNLLRLIFTMRVNYMWPNNHLWAKSNKYMTIYPASTQLAATWIVER